jgi:7-cyano-7-deazaguanine synthase
MAAQFTDPKNVEDTVIILSGGMDSTTLLYYLRDLKINMAALTFNYGQRHHREIACAVATCAKLEVPHSVIDLKPITWLINNSVLTDHSLEVPEGHYTDEIMKQTVVPNRNMIMLSIAIGYAENLKFDSVSIANHAGDHAIYPDCRTEFIDALNKASILGTYNEIKLFSPFTDMTKTGIAMIGLQLGIDYDKDTWSCYKGNEVHCGKCGTCVERLEALKEAKEQL